MIKRTMIVILIFFSLNVFIYASDSNNSNELSLSTAIVEALVAEDWKKISNLIGEVTSETPVIERYLKGHACIALNKNNEAVKLLKDTGSKQERNQWGIWTKSFFNTYQNCAIAAYLKGDALARQQKHEEAIQAFTFGLKISPHQALILNARAITYACIAKWNEAIVDINDASHLNPKLADVYATKGALNIRQCSGPRGALTAFQQALQISPDYTLSKIGKASALFGLGKWTEAEELLKECKLDPVSGHIAAMNAALIREAESRIEYAVLDEKTAGVAIDKTARDKQQRLESLNRSILLNDLGRVANTFVADTFRDIAHPVKAFANTYTGIQDLKKGNIASGVGKLAGVAETVGNNAGNLADLHGQLSQVRTNQWNHTMAEMRAISTSGIQGGISTEDIRQGHFDNGEWNLLSRFALQYPEPNDSVDASTRP